MTDKLKEALGIAKRLFRGHDDDTYGPGDVELVAKALIELHESIESAPWVYFNTPPNGTYPSVMETENRNTRARLVGIEPL